MRRLVCLLTFLALVLTPITLKAENFDISKVVDDLDNEDFYIREEAQRKLEACDGSLYGLILELAEKTDVLEKRYRLREVAESLFRNKAVKDEDKYKRYFGTFLCDIVHVSYDTNPKAVSHGIVTVFQILRMAPESPVKGMLKNGDIIPCMKDDDLRYRLLSPKPGEKFKLTVSRVQQDSLDDFGHILEERAPEVFENESKWEQVTVEITAVEKKELAVDQEGLGRYIDIRWIEVVGQYLIKSYGEEEADRRWAIICKNANYKGE